MLFNKIIFSLTFNIQLGHLCSLSCFFWQHKLHAQFIFLVGSEEQAELDKKQVQDDASKESGTI